MSLKRPFVPKSDVKQRFTTTTLYGRLAGANGWCGEEEQVYVCLLSWHIPGDLVPHGWNGYPE